MPVFYAPDIADRTCLPPEESAHCVRVLRLKEGEEIRLADGKGHFYRARISKADAKQCEVEMLEVLPQASDSIGLHLAVAPTKNADRMEWLAEKLTELGMPVVLVYLGFLNADEMQDRSAPFVSDAEWKQLVQAHSTPLFDVDPWEKVWACNGQSLVPLIR
ncbi:MAG TPA: RsmE family RNA methyltransferase, partial [Bacteroidales bacterium]|nr:RsmE family RNA methyltransferase [Bacteroidales bacterium]